MKKYAISLEIVVSAEDYDGAEKWYEAIKNEVEHFSAGRAEVTSLIDIEELEE